MIIIDVVFCVALFRLFVSKFRYFELRVASFRHFAWRFFRYFVILRGVFSLFRLFAWSFFVILLFRVALFRYFIFSRGVISLFPYFAWRYFVAKRRKDEMAQISHHTLGYVTQ